jgi:hypothetical protein
MERKTASDILIGGLPEDIGADILRKELESG